MEARAAAAILKSALATSGWAIANDPEKIRSVLRSEFSLSSEEVTALAAASQAGVPTFLMQLAPGALNAESVNPRVKAMESTFGVSAELARWAIVTWAHALGVLGEVSAGEKDRSALKPQGDAPKHERFSRFKYRWALGTGLLVVCVGAGALMAMFLRGRLALQKDPHSAAPGASTSETLTDITACTKDGLTATLGLVVSGTVTMAGPSGPVTVPAASVMQQAFNDTANALTGSQLLGKEGVDLFAANMKKYFGNLEADNRKLHSSKPLAVGPPACSIVAGSEKGAGTASQDSAAAAPSPTPPELQAVDAAARCDELMLKPSWKQGMAVVVPAIPAAEALPVCAAAANAAGPSQAHYQYLYGRVLEASRRYDEALQVYRQAAKGDDGGAMDRIGLMYQTGVGVPKSGADAYKWFFAAAQYGSPDGMYHLGRMYMGGSGVPEDDKQVVEWFFKAIKTGNADAMDNLGYLYTVGYGGVLPQSEKDAFDWYFNSAQAGSTKGMIDLGEMYEKGKAVDESDTDAVIWYSRAADAGNTQGMYHLASMYEDGKGVKQSYADAAALYQRAADAGDTSAMIGLGIMHQEGKGFPKSAADAVEWYTKAARAGDAFAPIFLDKAQKEARTEEGNISDDGGSSTAASASPTAAP